MELGVQFVVMLAFGAIVSFVAHGRGRSAVGWFFIGFVAPCLGLILVLVLPDLNVEQERHKRLRRDNQRLRERVRKDRQVADQRHAQTGKRLGAHDAVLGLDTGGDEDVRPPELPARRASPEAEWHYAPANASESFGPVSIATLRERRAAGAIDADCLFWRKGMDEWLALKELTELQELLDGA